MVGLRSERLASAGSDDSDEHAALDYPGQLQPDRRRRRSGQAARTVQRRLDLVGRLAGERDRPLLSGWASRPERSVRRGRRRRRGSQGVTGIALRDVGVPAWAGPSSKPASPYRPHQLTAHPGQAALQASMPDLTNGQCRFEPTADPIVHRIHTSLPSRRRGAPDITCRRGGQSHYLEGTVVLGGICRQGCRVGEVAYLVSETVGLVNRLSRHSEHAIAELTGRCGGEVTGLAEGLARVQGLLRQHLMWGVGPVAVSAGWGCAVGVGEGVDRVVRQCRTALGWGRAGLVRPGRVSWCGGVCRGCGAPGETGMEERMGRGR
jgi:hypothetical protein